MLVGIGGELPWTSNNLYEACYIARIVSTMRQAQVHGQKLQLLQQHCPLWLLQDGMKGENMDVRYLAQLRYPLAMSTSLFQQVTNIVQHTGRAQHTHALHTLFKLLQYSTRS